MYLDEKDLFIINSCILGRSFETIAKSLNFDKVQMRGRIELLMEKGIEVFPGMPGKKLRSIDLEAIDLLSVKVEAVQIQRHLKLSRAEMTNIYTIIPQLKPEAKATLAEKKERESESINQEIVRLWKEEGLNQKEIGGRIGKTRQEVARRIELMRKKGVSFNRELNENQKLVLELLQNGATRKQVIEQLKISPDTFNRYVGKLKRLGYSVRIARDKKKTFNLDETDLEILSCRGHGLSIENIAEKIGITPGAVSKRLRKMKLNGVDVSKKRQDNKNGRNEEIIQLYELGVKRGDIAKITGLSYPAICSIVLSVSKERFKGESKEKIVMTRTAKEVTPEMAEEMLKLHREGKSITFIAKKFGVTFRTAKKGCIGSRFGKTIKRYDKMFSDDDRERVITAIRNLMTTRNATIEQLKIIAPKYGIEIREILPDILSEEKER